MHYEIPLSQTCFQKKIIYNNNIIVLLFVIDKETCADEKVFYNDVHISYMYVM